MVVSIQMIRCESKKSLIAMKYPIRQRSKSLKHSLLPYQSLLLLLLASISNFIYADNNVKIKIEGVEGEVLSNVRNSLSIARETTQKDKPSLSKQDIQRLHNKAKKEIQQALQPFGYYQPTIDSSLTKTEKRWFAQYSIEPGAQVIIGNVSILIEGPGQNEGRVKQLTADTPLIVGETLNHQDYSTFKQTLYDTVFDLGYIDARYEKSELRVDIKNQKADIAFVLQSGPKYFFGDVKVNQSAVHQSLIDRLILIDTKTPFNTDRLLELQLRLIDTGYFSNAEITVEREAALNQRIPVTINMTPSKKLKYSTSIGYGTDTGPRVGLGVLNRRVNKYGHNLRYSIRLSQIESNLSAQYSIPIGNINSESIDLFANADQQNVNDTEAIQYSVGTSLNKNLWKGRARFSLTLIQEEFSFDNEPEQTANLLIPGIKYTRKKADNTLFTRKGYSLSADVHGGVESSLSETTFINANLSGRSVIPLNSRSRLLSRLELGVISTDEFDSLPPSERFFTGGSQSVRGYDYKDIGPVNSFGNNIGGQYLIAGSIEADYLLWGNYGMAIFYDAGDAAEDQQVSLKKSAGIGFRYRSAVGMIRVDFAHPFDDPDENFRFHISIGPDL